MKSKIDFSKDSKIIKKCIAKYINPDSISVDKNPESITFLYGIFIVERNKWTFDIDYSICTLPQEFTIVMNILEEVHKKNIYPIIFFGFYSIYTEDGIYVECVYMQDIITYQKKYGVAHYEALEILAGKELDKYYLENEVKENKCQKKKI